MCALPMSAIVICLENQLFNTIENRTQFDAYRVERERTSMDRPKRTAPRNRTALRQKDPSIRLPSTIGRSNSPRTPYPPSSERMNIPHNELYPPSSGRINIPHSELYPTSSRRMNIPQSELYLYSPRASSSSIPSELSPVNASSSPPSELWSDSDQPSPPRIPSPPPHTCPPPVKNASPPYQVYFERQNCTSSTDKTHDVNHVPRAVHPKPTTSSMSTTSSVGNVNRVSHNNAEVPWEYAFPLQTLPRPPQENECLHESTGIRRTPSAAATGHITRQCSQNRHDDDVPQRNMDAHSRRKPVASLPAAKSTPLVTHATQDAPSSLALTRVPTHQQQSGAYVPRPRASVAPPQRPPKPPAHLRNPPAKAPFPK